MLPNNNINIPYSQFLNQTTGRPNQEWLLWLMNPSFITLQLVSALSVESGGTGLTTIPTNGQLLIGNGTGYTLNPLAEGNYINVINGAGTIKVEWDNLLPPVSDPIIYTGGNPFDIAVGPSPFTYTNLTSYGLNIIISGGGVYELKFSRDGSTFYDTGSFYGFFYLSPYDQLKVTYATAPTMTGVPV